MARLKPIHKSILRALVDLDKVGSTRQIAQKAYLSVNGVSQALYNSRALEDYVERISDDKGGDTLWRLVKPLEEKRPKKKENPKEQLKFDEGVN